MNSQSSRCAAAGGASHPLPFVVHQLCLTGLTALTHMLLVFLPQSHLAFCPEDVILQIRQTGVFICNDDYEVVVSYSFTNLVMWSQAGDEVTLMLMRNLKRVVFKARSRWHAKRIVLRLTEVTEEVTAEMERKARFWGESNSAAADAQHVESLLELWAGGEEGALSDDEEEQITENNFRMFMVRQVHLTTPEGEPELPGVVILKVGYVFGLELRRKDNGDLVQAIQWSELVLWRSDGASLVLVLSTTNRQITLFADVSDEIIGYMTATTNAIYASGTRETLSHKGKELPHHAFNFRQQLHAFVPQKVVVDDAWNEAGQSRWTALKHAVGGTNNMMESIQTRNQLKAIVSIVDTDGSGMDHINIRQIGELMKHLGINSPATGLALSKAELQDIMIDMEATRDEVTFDDFVAWALRSSTGAGASSMLRMRVAHQKKEVQAIEELFDKVDQDCDGLLDVADFKLLIKQIGLTLNTQEFFKVWLTLDRNRDGDVNFEEFFKWIKTDSRDAVVKALQHAIRMTRLLSAGKSAMIYAVDRGSRSGKKALEELFDSGESRQCDHILFLLTMRSYIVDFG